MSVGSADLWKGITAAWDTAELDTKFSELWPSTTPTDTFDVLHEMEASPNQPFPYCVVEMEKPSVRGRMSGKTSTTKRETREAVVTFNIHTYARQGDNRGAKEIAAYLAEEVMKVFGGHPTVQATGTITLDNGNHLITQFQTDYSVRTEQEHYQWVLSYLFLVDVPVAVGA